MAYNEAASVSKIERTGQYLTRAGENGDVAEAKIENGELKIES
jgi:hypothetical protein